MSGVEMTVPFVLKFVGFSRRGIVTWRNCVIRSCQDSPSPKYVEEMSFLQRGWTRRNRAIREIREIGKGPACISNIIIIRDKITGDYRQSLGNVYYWLPPISQVSYRKSWRR